MAESSIIHHWLLVEEILVYLTQVIENFPTPQWDFEVIIATVQSLSPSNSPCYRYMDSVAGHLLSKLLSHPPFLFPLPPHSFLLPLYPSNIFSSLLLSSLLLFLPLLSLTVLPSQLPPLPLFVVGHSGIWLCVRSCVIDRTQTHTQTCMRIYQKSNAAVLLQKSPAHSSW